MLKKFFLIFFVLISTSLFASENIKNDFVLNLVEDVVYPLHFESKSQLSSILPAAVREQSSHFVFDYLFKVVEAEAESYNIELFIGDVKFFNFDVPFLVDEEFLRQFNVFWKSYSALFLSALQDIYLDLTLSKKGKLISLTGHDQFKEDVLKTLSTKIDLSSYNEFLQNFFSIFFGFIENQFDELYAFFPENEVALNDSWQVDIDIEQIDGYIDYKFVSQTAKSNSIFACGEVKLKSIGKKDEVAAKDWIEGYFVVDRDSNWILGGNFEISSSIESEVMVDGIAHAAEVKIKEYRGH